LTAQRLTLQSNATVLGGQYGADIVPEGAPVGV